ncbi:MAG: FliA/WhiG family RNA polymerase sigma factor [Acidobacteria bacterium]|nr:MAG: FliA/WhiG family RNA polymerase sigma factor [Acidobacteriota bacterium]
MRTARDTLVHESLLLVRRVALQVARRLPTQVELSDLTQAGCLGLLDAASRYDGARGVRFSTYAELRIRGSILDGLRELDWVPRSVRRRGRELDAASGRLEARLGRSPNETELAAELDIAVSDLGRIEPTVEMVETTDDLVRDPNAIDPHEALARRELFRILVEAIETLTKNERLVMTLYYYEELTMKAVGEVLGVNESRVSQIHKKAVRTLRKRLGGRVSLAGLTGLVRTAELAPQAP